MGLEAALVRARLDDWELHIRPQHPGPYRLLPGSNHLGQTEGTSLAGRVFGDKGDVLEELRLQGQPGYDQLIVYLETPDGRRTMAALKRKSSPDERPADLPGTKQ
jgi:hypothetical protein